MKAEKHTWLQNIQYFLYKYGLEDVWANPHLWDKDKLKLVLSNRLNDIFTQKYYEYVYDDNNEKKCQIIKECINNRHYSVQKYPNKIKSPGIRSIFTKFRININNTMDCKNRSFRYKNITNNLCTQCNEIQNVHHVMFKCKVETLYKNRQLFEERYTKYVKDFPGRTDYEKMRELLMLNPRCADEFKDKAIEVICNYIKILYSMTGDIT
jgi:hypothetical protein